MNILITGGTGFIGSMLCRHFLREKHHIVVLTRTPEKVQDSITTITAIEQLPDELSLDIVINLAGEPIANRRWSDGQKERIVNSRVNTTQHLIDYFHSCHNKPKLFISGSAIGFYGIAETNESIGEAGLGDNSFSSRLCQQWESKAVEARTLKIRTCILRTGIVLGQDGGALNKMLLPFKLGLGGKIGTGYQWMSWIHCDDVIGIIQHCIDHDEVSGYLNVTAPNPVINNLFTTTLGEVLKRPTRFPMPAWVVKLLMGEMGAELLLAGKKVLPNKILEQGYQFKFTNLKEALFNILVKQ